MSKLYFYYGTVCSSKTLNLLAVYKNYEIQGRKAVLIKPSIDSRSKSIESRAGLKTDPDIIINNDSSLLIELCNYFNEKIKSNNEKIKDIVKNIDALIVDECQFLTKCQVDELRQIATGISVKVNETNNKLITFRKQNYRNKLELDEYIASFPVLCYGLRTDCNGELWEASSSLFAQSDEIYEIKTVCSFCNKRAVYSAINPKLKNDNEQGIVNPSWNYYIPVCPEHYFALTTKNN